MSVGHINNIVANTPKPNNKQKDKTKNESSFSFIAGSTILGTGIGAVMPERHFIKNAEDVVPDNLNNLLDNPEKYTNKLGEKKAEKLKNALKSALTDFETFIKEKSKNLKQEISNKSVLENNTPVQEEKLEKIREENFKKLKKLVPREPVLKSAAKGAAIGGGLAFGIVVMSKILSEISPPEEKEI